MTVQAQDPFVFTSGNGISVTFGFNFPSSSPDFVLGAVDGVLQPDTTVVLNPDQSNDPGGNITFLVAPADETSVYIYRDTEASQELIYPVSGRFPAKATERSLDKLTMLIQDTGVAISNRALRIPKTEQTVNEIPTKLNRAGNFLAFDENGQPIATQPVEGKQGKTGPQGEKGDTGDLTLEQAADTFSNPNLLSNHNFLIPSPDAITPPSSTPTDYPSGTQILSGVFVGNAITGLTYIGDRPYWNSGDLYFAVPNTGAIANVNEFIASVADFDGKPRTRGVSFALVGDEYRVTVGIDALEDAGAVLTPLGSVKFEQGSVATRHDSQSYKGQTYSFSSVAEAVSNCPPIGSLIGVEDYYSGSNKNDSGVLFFKVVPAGSVTVDGGAGIAVDSDRMLKQNLKTPYSVKAWGAKGADNTADTHAFLKCADYITSVGGGTLLAPACNTGEYLVDEDILLGDNTTVITDAWVKRNSIGTRQYDTMLVPIPGAENVRIEKAMLDCNNIPSISGVNFRRNNKGCTGGVIRVKNAKISQTLGGGRAVLAEEGVTGRNPKLNAIDTIIAENCFNAFIFNGGAGLSEGDKSNAVTVVGKIVCTDVQCPVAFTGNNPTYPHNGAEMSCIVTTLMGTNCGVVTDPQPSSAVFGIVGGIRASNCEISSGYIYNDPSYSSGKQIYAYRGEYKNVKINLTIDSELDNIVFDGNSPISFTDDIGTTSGSSLATVADTRDFEVGYDISSPALPAGTKVSKVNSLGQITLSNNATSTGTNQATISGVSVCRDSEFNIAVNRTVNSDLFTTAISDAGHLLNNTYNFSVNQTNDNMVPNNINNQDGNYLFLRSKQHKCFVFGKIGSGNITSGFKISAFAGYMGQLGQIAMSDPNGNVHTLSANTTQLLFDGNPV